MTSKAAPGQAVVTPTEDATAPKAPLFPPSVSPDLEIPASVSFRAETEATPFVAPLDMQGRHFLSLKDFSGAEIEQLLSTASKLKNWYREQPAAAAAAFRPLVGESMAMIFQKRSTRTRVSTETGMARLGGHALFLADDDIQLGGDAESLEDTARVLSRFNSVILARVHGHDIIDTLAANSSVPIINALSDTYHPLQILADMLTLQETYRTTNLAGKTITWVGDGNNVLHSFMLGAAKLGVAMRVATPTGFEPFPEVTALANQFAQESGAPPVFLTTDPLEAVTGTDVIVTDTWVSMGQEEEHAARLKAFEGYQVTHKMAEDGGANPDWRFLHCLPRKPYEVNDAVFHDQGKSLVWEAADNRQWTVMSVALHLLRNAPEDFPPELL